MDLETGWHRVSAGLLNEQTNECRKEWMRQVWVWLVPTPPALGTLWLGADAQQRSVNTMNVLQLPTQWSWGSPNMVCTLSMDITVKQVDFTGQREVLPA
jgi:hypothetical protein